MKARHQSVKYFAVKYTEFLSVTVWSTCPCWFLSSFFPIFGHFYFSWVILARSLRFFTLFHYHLPHWGWYFDAHNWGHCKNNAQTQTSWAQPHAFKLPRRTDYLSKILSHARYPDLSQQQYHRRSNWVFALTPEQLAQLQEFLAAFQPTTEIVAENKASLIEKSQADFLTIVKTGLISTRYLAYLALVLQLEEQFPQLQRFFDLTALWFWAVLVSGALFF